ncbi:MAG TPA: nuclear transport factor 2 family protein [Gaiellaceae bacterium]|nr:nuclear transport factor 2 family protein [Gaiellaceae bacterium]
MIHDRRQIEQPAPIASVAESFIAAFPDIAVFADDLVVTDDAVTYDWTFTGTSAATGMSARIPCFEEWTIGADGLIAESRGHYDQPSTTDNFARVPQPASALR